MQGIRNAGEYELTDLRLYTGSGEVIDLSFSSIKKTFFL